MRLIGLTLMLFGAAVAWYLGIKGEDPATLRNQIFAMLKIAPPAPVLPAAQSSS